MKNWRVLEKKLNGQMLINQFATFLSNKSVLHLFSVIDDSFVNFFGAYHFYLKVLRIICLYIGCVVIFFDLSINFDTFVNFKHFLKNLVVVSLKDQFLLHRKSFLAFGRLENIYFSPIFMIPV